MNFSDYLNQAWQDHAVNSVDVANQFSVGLSLATSSEQLTQFIGLITHVMGEHLGEWGKGVEKLEEIKAHPHFTRGSEADAAIKRSVAALEIAGGQLHEFLAFGPSDRIRILSVAASALSERDALRAQRLLEDALVLAEEGLENGDPAHRALAVTGNNVACALEERSVRSEDETRLMIQAAKTGRIYWERAGTWLEISRAEYRLAMSYLRANQIAEAFVHAQICVELCRENNAGDVDLFFAYEALALTERARGNQIGFDAGREQARRFFQKLSPADQSWCESSLKKLFD